MGFNEKALESCQSALEALFYSERLGIVFNTQRLLERELIRELLLPICVTGDSGTDVFDTLQQSYYSSHTWFVPVSVAYHLHSLTARLLEGSSKLQLFHG